MIITSLIQEHTCVHTQCLDRIDLRWQQNFPAPGLLVSNCAMRCTPLTKWTGFVTCWHCWRWDIVQKADLRVRPESLFLPLFGQASLWVWIVQASFWKLRFELRFGLKIPRSPYASLLIKLRGAFKSIFAFLILLEGEVATQSSSLVCVSDLAANRTSCSLK